MLDVRTLIVPAIQVLINLSLQNTSFVQQILAAPGTKVSFTHLIKFILSRYIHSSHGEEYSIFNQRQTASSLSKSQEKTMRNNSLTRHSHIGHTDINKVYAKDLGMPHINNDDVLNCAIRSLGFFTLRNTANQV